MSLLKITTTLYEFFKTLRFFLCINRRYNKSNNRFNNDATNSKFNNNATNSKFNNNATSNKFNNNAIVKIITNKINKTFNEVFNEKSRFAFTFFFVSTLFRSDY